LAWAFDPRGADTPSPENAISGAGVSDFDSRFEGPEGTSFTQTAPNV